MRKLNTRPMVHYATPYIPYGEPFACKTQFSFTSIILTSLLFSLGGYVIKRYASKQQFANSIYTKLPKVLQDTLPYSSAIAIGVPMYLIRAASVAACKKGLRAQISQLQM